MTRILNYYDWLPSPKQELLLQAALLHGQPARLAWEEWSRTVNLDQLDFGSFRLLPLLYHNLKKEGIVHPLIGHFKTQYLETWAKNRILIARITPLLDTLHQANINTLVLKGIPLIVRYYKDYGLRPMSDFDFLVPTKQAIDAINLLRQLGWEYKLSESPNQSLVSFLSMRHSLSFTNPARCEVDLHWHLLSMCLAVDAERDFWRNANPIEINGVEALCLNPADDLFHICVHGVHRNKLPPIRWVADVMTILNSGLMINWGRIAELAENFHLILPLKDALSYLQDKFKAPIPENFLQNLGKVWISKEEIIEYNIRVKNPFWDSYISDLWAYYPRIARDTGRSPTLFGFLRVLQHSRGLEHGWELPLSLGSSILRSIPGILLKKKTS